MPDRIHQLPQTLINKIAAGEVIERPASVVKELVENAIDAGAGQIVVEIEDGGLSLIRVVDNGAGISAGDLPLAFAPHATSKLQTDEDLFAIGTMGFRGEALASIGSVSQARILSRTTSDDSAYEILNRGGQISDPQAAAGNVGTMVEVRNLFFNTPGRRKFLRGPTTEFGHISEMVLRLAMPQARIGFKLLHNGRTALDLPAGDAMDRLLAAWPAEFAEQRLNLDARDAEIQLHGLIGLPELARPTAKYQYFFLNGRTIRDRFIQHALREAYRGLTEPGRQPAGILLLEIPAQDVDVNVHPTKAEVRFKDSGRIHGLVQSAVRERLLGADLTPRAVPRSDLAPVEDRRQLQEQLADFFRRPPAPAEMTGNRFVATDAEPWREPQFPPSASEDELGRGGPDRGDTPRLAPVALGRQLAPPAADAVSAIQLHNAYLVAESDDGLIIIDQHALHERIMYEELLGRLSAGPLESQRLLLPPTFSASARQIDLLEQIKPLLGRLGIELSPIGPAAVAVQAFPSFLSRLDPAEFVAELLERGEQELLDLTQEELLHKVLDMMACKAAVKAGDPLTPGEIQALLSRRGLVDRSSNCPHGRPTTLRLSLHDLEKQFKRTGF